MPGKIVQQYFISFNNISSDGAEYPICCNNRFAVETTPFTLVAGGRAIFIDRLPVSRSFPRVLCANTRLVHPTIGQVRPLTQNRKVGVPRRVRARASFSWERLSEWFSLADSACAWKGKPPSVALATLGRNVILTSRRQISTFAPVSVPSL